MKPVALILGVLIALLGGLWLLQGLGLVRMQPVLCVADCAPLEGPSLTWAVVGFCTLAIGALAIHYGVKRRKTNRS